MEAVVPDDLPARAQSVRDHVASARRELEDSLRAGEVPSAVAARFAERAEVLARSLFEKARAGAAGGPPMALVALGSLGRGEMAPYSDIDLVLVTPQPDEAQVKRVANELFYPLWDARLEVGNAVRTPEQFAALAAEDETVRTAALDWRALAGDAAPKAALAAALRQALASGAVRRSAAATLADWLAEETPATVYRLQPDVKSGPGGLRELHRVWWAARLVWNIARWPDLLQSGLVSKQDYDLLIAGREVLLGLRLAMHALAKRRQEQLRFDLQDEVAALLGVPADAAGRPPANEMLRRFYQAAKGIRRAASHVLARCHEALVPPRRPEVVPQGDIALWNGSLTFRDAAQLEADPLAMVRLLRAAQEQGKPLHVGARERIAEAAPRLLTPEVAHSPPASRQFIDVLTFLRDGGRTLELMHELGVLERIMPEFAVVSGLAQRDLYHTYTVDAHLIYCARRVIDVLAGKADGLPADFATVAERISRPHVLILGCLLHDIGKGHGHGHSERGADMAQVACERLGLLPEDTADVVFLVLEHLALFKLSQRRDLEDHELVARFADKVQSLERLDLLLLLSYADATTTGPEAWSEWKGALLRELYQRTREALRGGVAAQSLAARAAARALELRARLETSAPALADDVTRLSPRHLVGHHLPLLERHLRALADAAKAGSSASIELDPRRGGWEIVVVGADRPGLLADLAGVLAAAGVSIDGAQISSDTSGSSVIDTFIVAKGKVPTLDDPGRRSAIVQRLVAALVGKAEFESGLRERQRAARSLGASAPLSETRLVFDDEAASDATVIDLFTPDRVGLLRDVARAMFDAGASIALARITTEGGRAVDSFYVVSSATGRPLDGAERERLEEAVRAAADATGRPS
jgi:[protein-PII] uridylyltransferase